MASNYAFFAHRLGYRDVDCEKGHCFGSSGGELVVKDDDFTTKDEVARDNNNLLEKGRRRCTNPERKHTWHHRCDVLSFPRIRSTTSQLNPSREPPTLPSHIISTSPLSSALLLQADQTAVLDSLTRCGHPQGAESTLPISDERPQFDDPHGETSSSQEAARPRVFHSVTQHCLIAREDKAQHPRKQAGSRSEEPNSVLSSFPTTFALEQTFPFQGERRFPKALSEPLQGLSGDRIRPLQEVEQSPTGPRLNPVVPSQRISAFSFSSQHDRSFAASLTRLKKTILKFEGAICEILNAHAVLDLSPSISLEGNPDSLLTAIRTTFETEAPKTTKMPNPFHSSCGKTTPKESRDTPPRAIFSDYPAAHSAITNIPAVQGEKIPSPTPGMPAMENPYARLPPTIDLPETPAKHTGGLASEEIKARVASSPSLGAMTPERPESPLLPPTPIMTRHERGGASSQNIGQLFREPFPEEFRPSSGTGEEAYELKILKPGPHNDQSAVDHHDRDTETPQSVSTFGLESSLKRSPYSAVERHESGCRSFGPDVHQSSTLDSIIGKYNDDSELLQIREGSQRTIEISNSQEVSSLSADEDGEIHFRDSTAGHTPPLANLMFARKAPERSTSGQPPKDPLPDVPSRQAFSKFQDTSGSEPTNYGHTRDLLNLTADLEQRDPLQAPDSAGCSRHRGLVFNPDAGMSTIERLLLVKQGGIPVYREISDKEREMLEMSVIDGSPYFGNEFESGIGDESAASHGGLLRPLAYKPNSDNVDLTSIGLRPARYSAVFSETEDDEEPVLLRRQPQLIPITDITKLRQVLDPGGPQSSSSQDMSVSSSFGQYKTASRRFQHDETLASLTSEVQESSHRNMQSLIEDVGVMFKVRNEDDSAVFDKDVPAVQDKEEADDGDWETVHESGLKPRIPQKLMTNPEETTTSLANNSSCGSLTGSVPATPWGPLTRRGRVLTHPPKVAFPYRERMRKDTETNLSVTLPEYEVLDEPYGDKELGMTRGMRLQVLERPFPAFSGTDHCLATAPRRFYATYRHPDPISQEHEHPFSVKLPAMVPTDGGRANFLTNPGTGGEQGQYMGLPKSAENGGGHGRDAEELGLEMSKSRNTQQQSASASEKSLKIYMPDTRDLSRPSNLSADGSYTGSFHSSPPLSTSSIVHDSQYLPHTAGTFSKSTILGLRSNITGSFDGTGMRAVGSSEADYSTDSAMIKSHKYERLDDERTQQAQPSITNSPAAGNTPKTPKRVTFAKIDQKSMADSTSVLTKNGLSISAPKEFKIPTTVPKRNSFAISTLNTAKRLNEVLQTTPSLFDYGDKANISELIKMAADDWKRLQSECMTFPLRDDHLNDMLELDGISTGQKRCFRDNLQPDGRFMESAKCDNCNRWERSHAAVLIRRPFNTAQLASQQEIGRKIVFWSVVVPFIGWGFLFAIANRMEASSELIAGFSNGVIREFGANEIEAAGFYFKCVIGGLFVLFLALLIFTVVIVTQS